MKEKEKVKQELLSYYEMLSDAEQKAVFTLVRTMANSACLKDTGSELEYYNKEIELAEKEETYTHADTVKTAKEWLKKKKQALA